MTDDGTRALYEAFPYPSPDVEGPLIRDTAFGVGCLLEDDVLDGWRILDLGCGTGHRLVALAQQYPRAELTGIDASEHSLEVAHKLTQRHGVTNVRLVHGPVPETTLPETFDLVVSTGVLHHLPSPEAGLRWAVDHLVDDGLVYAWFYGALGEHGRMLDRELVRILAGSADTHRHLEVVRALGLRLSRTRYGATSDGGDATWVQDAIDADAYLNPIVTPMTFRDVGELFAGQDLDWVAAFGVNTDEDGKLLDLGDAEPGNTLTLGAGDLFADPGLRRRFDALPVMERARAVEYRLRPTGITIVAGRGDSLADCVPRVTGNVVARPRAGRAGPAWTPAGA